MSPEHRYVSGEHRQPKYCVGCTYWDDGCTVLGTHTYPGDDYGELGYCSARRVGTEEPEQHLQRS